jgi:short-subunit dehydrogenase
MTWAGMGHYAATKAAISVATETLQLELGGSGVRVLEVLPGPVDTAVQAESRLAPGFAELTARTPMGDAAVLARMIARALENGRARIIYPRLLAATYHLPGLARTITRRHARRLGQDGSLRENPMVVRTGSHGDPLSIEARRQWEQEQSKRQS